MIVDCSTGFYYTEESVLFNTPVSDLCDYVLPKLSDELGKKIVQDNPENMLKCI